MVVMALVIREGNEGGREGGREDGGRNRREQREKEDVGSEREMSRWIHFRGKQGK